jgi:ribosomal protein L7Ae-like RNA K-turn-binding protein
LSSNHPEKLLSMLGLCRKAGKLTLGFDSTAEAIRGGQARLILLTRDISQRSGEKIAAAAEHKKMIAEKTPLTMEDIAGRFGKASGIIGITDKGLADAVLRIVRTHEEDTEC